MEPSGWITHSRKGIPMVREDIRIRRSSAPLYVGFAAAANDVCAKIGTGFFKIAWPDDQNESVRPLIFVKTTWTDNEKKKWARLSPKERFAYTSAERFPYRDYIPVLPVLLWQGGSNTEMTFDAGQFNQEGPAVFIHTDFGINVVTDVRIWQHRISNGRATIAKKDWRFNAHITTLEDIVNAVIHKAEVALGDGQPNTSTDWLLVDENITRGEDGNDWIVIDEDTAFDMKEAYARWPTYREYLNSLPAARTSSSESPGQGPRT